MAMLDFIYNNYFLIWISILGLCLGSFYNVVIIRSLSGESIVFPPSKCPKCGNKLKPWHNIPIFSYLFLGGKCTFCKSNISVQYPLIEFITMVLFAFSYIKFGLEWKTLFIIILLSGMLIMTATDLKEKLVDCNIAIVLAFIGILYNWLVNHDVLNSIFGLIVAVVVMEILAATGYIFKKGRAFGEADTFVAASLGASFGLSLLPQIFLYTLIASALFIIPIFIHNQYKNNQKSICISFILFILSALIYKTVFANVILLIVLAMLGLLLSIQIMRNLGNTENPLYLPLVPAFSLGALFFIFF